MSKMKEMKFDGRIDEVIGDHKDLHDKLWKLQRGEIGILEVLKVVNKIRDDELAMIDLICEYEIDRNKTISIPEWVNKTRAV